MMNMVNDLMEIIGIRAKILRGKTRNLKACGVNTRIWQSSEGRQALNNELAQEGGGS